MMRRSAFLLVLGMLLSGSARAQVPASLPASVDLRPQFARYGLGVRQQGKRGSCQVFAMVATAEFLAARDGHPINLSEQYLMWAANQANHLQRTEGFNPDLLIRGWRAHGICQESLLPYIPRNEPIAPPGETVQREAASRTPIAFTSLKHWTAPIGFDNGLIQAICFKLARQSPVTVTFCWPTGLTDPEIVDAQNFLIDTHIDGTDKSGHGVVLVGYGRDEAVPGGGYFWIRNSWSEKFADHGYCKISFAMAQKYGIDAYIVRLTR